MDDRYNYEDSFLTKEEKKVKVFNEVFEKENKKQRKALKIVFPILGLVYGIIGIIMLLVDEETLVPGIVFCCLGLFFVFLGLIMSSLIKSKTLTGEQIEKMSNKGAMYSYYMYETRIKLLEDEVQELKNKIENLERKLR